MEMAPVELVALASEAVRTADRGRPRVARAVLGVPPGRGDGRQGPAAPGSRQPAGQRAGPHAARARRPRCASTRWATRPRSWCTTPDRACRATRHGGSSSASTGSDPARARTAGGSGLGLSIVAAIVAAHGGTVSAASSPGHGMAVTVRLPEIAMPARTRRRRAVVRNPPPDRGSRVAPPAIHTGATAEVHGPGGGGPPCLT